MEITFFGKYLHTEKNERTLEAKKNIIFSFLLKGIGIIISFLLVPMTLHYLNTSEYGVWLTISSLMTWISYFDIGLGNGLRNQLAKSITLKDYKLGQIYVSTTFAILTLIIFLFFIIFIIINPFLEWDRILNTKPEMAKELKNIVLIVFSFFSLQFIFKTVGTILIANQKPAMNDLIGVIGNLLSLIAIFILTKITTGSLLYVSITFSAAPLIVFICAYFYLFYGKYRYLKPTFNGIQFKYTKELIGLGIQFFIIQIAVCIIAYTSTNIIIAQLFDNDHVTTYNIAFKYFFSLSMAYIIVITPFWSASTDAYTQKDFKWIQMSLRKLLYIYGASVLFLILMVLISNQFYLIWVGNSVKIPTSLSILVALYVAFYNWSSTFIYFINGIGKIRLQLYITLSVAIIYIPIAIYLGHSLGLNGVIIASIVALIPSAIFMPIQMLKLYSNKASGIWNK